MWTLAGNPGDVREGEIVRYRISHTFNHRGRSVLALLTISFLSACAAEMTQQQAKDASIEELRRARAEMMDIGNVDFGRDRETYRERLVMQAGPKLGWNPEDTRRAAKGEVWEGMTRDQLWWSWGEAWKVVPEDGAQIWQWGPWVDREPMRSVRLVDDRVVSWTMRPPPG
jgi:hypothetical protein